MAITIIILIFSAQNRNSIISTNIENDLKEENSELSKEINEVEIERLSTNDNEEKEQKSFKVLQNNITSMENIAYLTIPDILLEKAPIKEGTELEILSEAIGHFKNTNMYSGNIGLASHNSGEKGDYFKDLKDIKIGSKIYYQTQYGTKKYIVNTKEEIEETDLNYLRETEDNRITLITCVKGKRNKRLCVQAIEN